MRLGVAGILTISSAEAIFHYQPRTHAILKPNPRHQHLCAGTLCKVAIPQFSETVTKGAPRTVSGSPVVFHTHGLIQVQAPPRLALAPRDIATNFALETPTRGKVVERTEPTYFCKKPGFVLDGVDCVETVFEEPKMLCPGGYETFSGEGCVRRAELLQSCPVGFIKRNGSCAKLITQAFVEVCPDGTVAAADGVGTGRVCHRQVPHPLTPTCPEGLYDSKTGNCIISVYEDAKAYCPEGFVFDEKDGVCLQEEIYDCSHQPLVLENIPQLGVTNVAPARHHHRRGRNLHLASRITLGHHHTTPVTTLGRRNTLTTPVETVATGPCAETIEAEPCAVQPCVQQKAVEPCEPRRQVIVQPTKTTISVQKTCTRITSTALIFDCDQGLLQGQKCLVKQSVPPLPICQAQGDTEFCYSLQRAPALQECPEGFTKECPALRHCHCVALEAAAFVTSCPTGYSTAAEGCERTAVAQAVCPFGFALQGDSCVRVIREPADCVFSVTYECDRSTDGECL